MPVLVDMELWFAVPGTQDLTSSSPTTTCPYYSTTIPLRQQKLLPPSIISYTRLQPFLFDAPPLFQTILDYQAAAIRSKIESIQQQQMDITTRLQKRGIVLQTISTIKNATEKVGKSIRLFYESTTAKLTSGVEEIRWSLKYLTLWIGIPLAVIAISIGICIICVKIHLFTTAVSTAASAVFNTVRTILPRRARQPRRRAINLILTDLDPDQHETPFIPRIYALQTNNTQLPYLKVTIGDDTATALLDSGASISCMRKSTLRSTGKEIQTNSQKFAARTANGTLLQLLGSVPLPVRIGTHTILHRFHIATDGECPAPILLGSDFIRNLNEAGLTLTMDLHNNTLQVGSDTLNLVQLNYISLVPTTTFTVRICGNNHPQSRTNNIIPAIIEGLKSPICSSFLIEDNLRPFDDIFIVGRALVSPQPDGHCFINILNPSCKNVTLPDRLAIATAYPACPSELFILDLYLPQPTRDHPSIHALLPDHTEGCFDQSTSLPTFEVHIPPEADWEKRLPLFPTEHPQFTYDIAQEVDLSQAALDDQQKEQLRDIIRHHAQAFVGPDGNLGHYRGPIRHRIDLIENAPIPARKIYRVPLEKREEIEKQITQMLKDGIIRESSSPFCAPIVLVRKREANTWRFTIDYRGLNAITKPQQSILPNIQDIVDLCANQSLYTSLDFQQGFHQIPL